MQYIKETVFVFASIALIINGTLFIPQAIRILREKSAAGISATTFVGFNVIQFILAIHGYFNNDPILMAGMIYSLITCGFVTLLIFKYKKKSSDI